MLWLYKIFIRQNFEKFILGNYTYAIDIDDKKPTSEKWYFG